MGRFEARGSRADAKQARETARLSPAAGRYLARRAMDGWRLWRSIYRNQPEALSEAAVATIKRQVYYQ